MTSKDRIASAHQALGEFVIVFQWVENLYRQIGWFILDPDREQWPPMRLRRETNSQLINQVTDMFVNLTNAYVLPAGDERRNDILELRECFHRFRRFRNQLLHSTYVEIESGGEVHGYLRSNPQFSADPDTGELISDQGEFSAEIIQNMMQEYSGNIFRLNLLYSQLIHWAPFDRHAMRGRSS